MHARNMNILVRYHKKMRNVLSETGGEVILVVSGKKKLAELSASVLWNAEIYVMKLDMVFG